MGAESTVIEIREHPEGVILPVRVQAGARENAIRGVHGGCLKVAVTAAPERGKANQVVVELLGEKLGVPVSQFSLLTGQTQPRKRFLIRGWTREELVRRVVAILPPSKS